MVDIEQYCLEQDTTQMEAMLQMIDPGHSIIIDNNIGLLGEFTSEEDEKHALASNKSEMYDIDNMTIGRLHDKHTLYKRGDFFKVIDSDGCILFDEYIRESGIIYRNNSLYGYLFVLRDYEASQVFDTFFDDEAFCAAVVLYINDKLYINNVLDEELMNKFEYREDIKIEFIKQGEYKLEFENTVYYSYNVDSNNGISIYKAMKMQL